MNQQRPFVVLALAAGVTLVLAAVAIRADDMWRMSYPHLPRRLQGAPYRLRAELSGPTDEPAGVPTAGLQGRSPVLPPPSSVSGWSQSARAIEGEIEATAPPRLSAAGSEVPIGSPTSELGLAIAPTVGQPREATSTAAPVAKTGGAAALPSAAHVGELVHEYQTWNNCGPATVSMALSHWGVAGDQAAAASALKPDPDDKNVSPSELARYARSRGLVADVRRGGSVDDLKRLLAAGVPVIVETWFVPEPGDEMGHYRVLTGYDDASAQFVAHDSYNGPDVTLAYDEFDALWRVFDRVYVPVYPSAWPVHDSLVQRADDDARLAEASFAAAQDELQAHNDAFAWFNFGAALLRMHDPAGAAGAFDTARDLGLPWRLLWYRFEPFEAYAAADRWDDVAALAQANLRNADNLEESHYWLGRAREASGDLEGAMASWRRALDLNPLYEAAAEALEDADNER